MTGLLTHERGSSKKKGIDSRELEFIFPFFNITFGWFQEEDVNTIVHTLIFFVNMSNFSILDQKKDKELCISM